MALKWYIHEKNQAGDFEEAGVWISRDVITKNNVWHFQPSKNLMQGTKLEIFKFNSLLRVKNDRLRPGVVFRGLIFLKSVWI